MFANTNTFKLFNVLKSRLKLIKHDERWDNSSTRTPVFLSAFASANTTPVADFSLMISHEAFCGTRTTATAIGLPVRRSFDCWNSTISVQSTQLIAQQSEGSKKATGFSKWQICPLHKALKRCQPTSTTTHKYLFHDTASLLHSNTAENFRDRVGLNRQSAEWQWKQCSAPGHVSSSDDVRFIVVTTEMFLLTYLQHWGKEQAQQEQWSIQCLHV